MLSCKKLVEVNPPTTSINGEIVFKNDASAIAVLTGIYTRMSQSGITGGLTSVSLFSGLSADEITLYSGVDDISYLGFFTNSLTSATSNCGEIWTNAYSVIYTANSAIEELTKSTSLTQPVKDQLLGESRFIRAFCYFYLVNLFGDVPLSLTSDYKLNSTLPRSSKTEVVEHIIMDLKESQALLTDEYRNGSNKPTSERTSPNKWCSIALLSRVYLYIKDYLNAEKQATLIINQTAIYDTVPINEVFLKNSKETIWQLQPVDNVVSNTSEARVFILPIVGPDRFGNRVYLSDYVVNSFEPMDKRKSNWINEVVVQNKIYHYPYKYKNNELFSPVTEYSVILRIAEQYLIRAEARALLGNMSQSIADLNVIRIRAGLSPLVISTTDSLLNAISQERKVELFTEWGHRWLDLNRTGKIDSIMQSIKGSNWQSTDKLYPLPQSDIDRNPNLRGHQNPGYN
jgi:hypothetical protein